MTNFAIREQEDRKRKEILFVADIILNLNAKKERCEMTVRTPCTDILVTYSSSSYLQCDKLIIRWSKENDLKRHERESAIVIVPVPFLWCLDYIYAIDYVSCLFLLYLLFCALRYIIYLIFLILICVILYYILYFLSVLLFCTVTKYCVLNTALNRCFVLCCVLYCMLSCVVCCIVCCMLYCVLYCMFYRVASCVVCCVVCCITSTSVLLSTQIVVHYCSVPCSALYCSYVPKT